MVKVSSFAIYLILLYLPILWQDIREIYGNQTAELHPYNSAVGPYKIYLYVNTLAEILRPLLYFPILSDRKFRQSIFMGYLMLYEVFLVHDFILYYGRSPERTRIAYTGIAIMVLYRIHETYKDKFA